MTRLDLSLSTEDKTQGGKTQKQTATEDNAWQETQHLVSIIFRSTRVVSQITVQSAKMAVIPKLLLQHVHYCGEQRQKTKQNPVSSKYWRTRL